MRWRRRCGNQTISYDDPGATQSLSATIDLDSLQEQEGGAAAGGYDYADLDDSKTISIYQSDKMETPTMAPTVGWLVCTKGRFYGQDSV